MEHTAQLALGSLVLALALGSLITWLAILRRMAQGRPLAEYEVHPLVPWNGLDICVLVAIALFIEDAAQLGVTRDELESGVSVTQMTAAGIARAIWIFFAVTYLVLKTGAFAEDLGLALGTFRRDMWLAGRLFLAAVLPVYGVQVLLVQGLGLESDHPLKKLATEHGTLDVLLLSSVVAVIVAPLAEELLFRVILQGWLEKKTVESRRRWGVEPAEPAGWGPIVATSFVFGMLHFGHGPDPVALFMLSLFLGYAYQRTHRIAAPLAIHMFVNALAMLELWVAFLTGTS